MKRVYIAPNAAKIAEDWTENEKVKFILTHDAMQIYISEHAPSIHEEMLVETRNIEDVFGSGPFGSYYFRRLVEKAFLATTAGKKTMRIPDFDIDVNEPSRACVEWLKMRNREGNHD